MDIEQIVWDERKIKLIEKQLGEGSVSYEVGRVYTKIVAYWEVVPWIAVYKGDEIFARMDATNCVIIYAEKESEE